MVAHFCEHYCLYGWTFGHFFSESAQQAFFLWLCKILRKCASTYRMIAHFCEHYCLYGWTFGHFFSDCAPQASIILWLHHLSRLLFLWLGWFPGFFFCQQDYCFYGWTGSMAFSFASTYRMIAHFCEHYCLYGWTFGHFFSFLNVLNKHSSYDYARFCGTVPAHTEWLLISVNIIVSMVGHLDISFLLDIWTFLFCTCSTSIYNSVTSSSWFNGFFFCLHLQRDYPFLWTLLSLWLGWFNGFFFCQHMQDDCPFLFWTCSTRILPVIMPDFAELCPTGATVLRINALLRYVTPLVWGVPCFAPMTELLPVVRTYFLLYRLGFLLSGLGLFTLLILLLPCLSLVCTTDLITYLDPVVWMWIWLWLDIMFPVAWTWYDCIGLYNWSYPLGLGLCGLGLFTLLCGSSVVSWTMTGHLVYCCLYLLCFLVPLTISWFLRLYGFYCLSCTFSLYLVLPLTGILSMWDSHLTGDHWIDWSLWGLADIATIPTDILSTESPCE